MFDYFGGIASYIVIAIPIFAGVYDSLDEPALSEGMYHRGFLFILMFRDISYIRFYDQLSVSEHKTCIYFYFSHFKYRICLYLFDLQLLEIC